MKNKKQIEVKEAQSKPKRGRPTEIKRDITKTSQSGLREGLTRATFIIREDTLDKLKERAYTDRKKLKDLVTEALDYYLDNHKETKTSKSNIQIKVQVAKTILGNLEDLIDAGALRGTEDDAPLEGTEEYTYWCDFVSADTRLPANARIFIRRVHRDNEAIAELEKEVRIFLEEVDQTVEFIKNYKGGI